MSEATHYWPGPDQPGEYPVERKLGDEKDWTWDGAKWRRGMWFRDTSQMVEYGYLGVRREAEKPKVVQMPILPIEDDQLDELVAENAGLMNQLDMIRKAVKAVYEAAHWTADRPCDEAKLWERLRDEAEIEPGQSPKPVNNAATAQQALDEWRNVKQQPKAADWAYRWAVKLCEIAGAR